MYIYIYIHIYIYMHIYVCIYIYIYILIGDVERSLGSRRWARGSAAVQQVYVGATQLDPTPSSYI